MSNDNCGGTIKEECKIGICSPNFIISLSKYCNDEASIKISMSNKYLQDILADRY